MPFCLRLMIASLIVALGGGPALALSCMRPDVATSYVSAAQSKDAYLVVLGELRHDIPPIENDLSKETPSLGVAGKFVGKSLSNAEFAQSVDLDIQMNLTCASVWCARLPAQKEQVLAFLKHTAQGYVLDLGPCDLWMFRDPTPEQVNRVLSCNNGDDCKPGQ